MFCLIWTIYAKRHHWYVWPPNASITYMLLFALLILEHIFLIKRGNVFTLRNGRGCSFFRTHLSYQKRQCLYTTKWKGLSFFLCLCTTKWKWLPFYNTFFLLKREISLYYTKWMRYAFSFNNKCFVLKEAIYIRNGWGCVLIPTASFPVFCLPSTLLFVMSYPLKKIKNE